MNDLDMMTPKYSNRYIVNLTLEVPYTTEVEANDEDEAFQLAEVELQEQLCLDTYSIRSSDINNLEVLDD